MSKSTESIGKGFDILGKNPMLLAPFAVPIIIQILFDLLAYMFPMRYYYGPFLIAEEPNIAISLLGTFLAAITGFIAACMLVDMVNDFVSNQPINLRKSLNYVMSRIGMLIVIAIIAAIFSITIILLPIAMFIVVVAIIERTGVIESIKRTFSFVAGNLGEVVIFVIIVIVIGIIFSLGFSLIPVVGPYIGAIISWILNAFFTTSAVYLYLSLKPPPPPPPPQQPPP